MVSEILEKRLTYIALTLGVIAIAGSLLIGVNIVSVTTAEIEEQFEQFYLTKARSLAALSVPALQNSDSTLLGQIYEVWATEQNLPADEYICVVNHSSELILHSSVSQSIGDDIGQNLLTEPWRDTACTMGDLVKVPRDYVGGYISSSGENQIAAFAPIPDRGWLIGVHRSKRILHDTIRAKLNAQIWGMLSISLGIIPLALGLLYFSFIRINRERKQAETDLKESEEKYRLIVENANDGIEITQNDKILFSNTRFAEMLGYTVSEIENTVFSKVFAEQGLKDLNIRSKKRELGEVVPNHYETTLCKKDGTLIDVDVKYEIIDYHGEPATFAVVRDITERKQAEEELRKLSVAVKQSPVSILITDKKGNIEYVNPKFMELTGYGLHEAIGQKSSLLKSGEQPDSYYKTLWTTISSGETWKGEFHNKKKNGELFWESASISPIRDDSGNITQYIAIKEDITERKQAEEKIIQSEEKYRTLVLNVPGMTYRANPDWSTNIISKSETVCGYPPNDFNTQKVNWLDIIHPDDKQWVYEESSKLIEKPQSIRQEYRIIEIAGGTRWVSDHKTSYFNDDGSLLGIDGIVFDITERKKAESEISAALLIAEQANSVKDQFIANISHEIRTPLNSILGFSDLFKQRYGDVVSVRDKDIFQFITNSSNRLMRTVDSIVNISQLVAGSIKIHKHELDLNHLVRSVLGEMKPAADEKGLDLVYDASDQLAMVCVDNYALHQALLHLVDNAVKYTNTGRIVLHLKAFKHKYKLHIQDTGIGISEEYQKRIFNPYTQESEGFTKNYQGIGLGLALTKRYLELNSIDLELESKKNVGTTFTLIFPKSDGSDHV